MTRLATALSAFCFFVATACDGQGDESQPNGSPVVFASQGDTQPQPPSADDGQVTDEAPVSSGTPTEPPAAPAPADEPGLDCETVYADVGDCYAVYYDCASACADQACGDTCQAHYNTCAAVPLEAASPGALNAYESLRSCEESHWDACYEEGGVVYQSCVSDCSDDACAQGCNEDANEVLRGCVETSCASLYEECGVDADAPADEPTTEPTRTDTPAVAFTCSEVYLCEDGCDGDQACGQACYDQGSQAAKSQWTSLIQCGITYCNGQAASAQEYQACLAAMCPSEWGTCFDNAAPSGSGPENTGTGTCGAGFTCVQSCYASSTNESTFFACVDGCYAAMNATAHLLMDSLNSCADTQCSGVPGSVANYFKCIEDFCPAQHQACVAQPEGQ